MDSPSWKIKELMEQIRHDVEQTNETMSLLISELEKQKIENERRNNEQLAQIAEERRKWDEEKARMQRITSLASDIIILNVGGERMYTYRSTLTIDPDSDLAAMFSGKWEDVIPKDKDGYVFLDFDPNLFNYLLNQLRNWSDTSTARVLRPPSKDKEPFLQLVRRLRFNERCIQSGKSIISSISTVVQPEEGMVESADRETNTAVSVIPVTEPQSVTQQSTDDGINNITNDTTPSQQIEQPTNNETIMDTNTITMTETNQETNQSTSDTGNNTSTNVDNVLESNQETQQSTPDIENNTSINADNVSKLNQELQCFQTKDFGDIKLSDNKRTCEKVSLNGIYQSVFGTLFYSSGIHQIRLKVEKGSEDIFCGICSQSNPPSKAYLYDEPTVYGWFLHGYMILNGQHPQSGSPRFDEGNILEITIDCDQQSLIIRNEKDHEGHKIEVDIKQAPLPWCLLIILHYRGGRLSLI